MRPTNLLFILSDQHNRDASGCYGHPFVETPHLDRLAESGVRFDNAYTNCPICVPARASLATGQYVHKIGYWDNAHPYEGRVPGWGHRLIDAGHRVESIGKLHYRDDADDDGFSKHIVPLNVVKGIGDVMASVRDNPPVRLGSRDGILHAGPGTSTYLDFDVEVAGHAVNWLRERNSQPVEKPWVLFVSFVCPHPPYIAPPDLFDLYASKPIDQPVQSRCEDWPRHPVFDEYRRVMQWEEPFTEEEIRRVTAAYYGCCTHLDRQIGRVLDTVSELGLNDATRIIYTCDHGESMGRRGLFGKFTMYEESAAIPFILSGPDVPQGEVCKEVISLVDCHQTILAATGVPLTDADENLPGTSLWPLARGDADAPRDRVALSEYHAVACKSGYYMLRYRQFKYVYYVNAPPQLFDLETDPQETVNLAENADHTATRADMDRRLREILDPEAIDAAAKASQAKLIETHGGFETVLAGGQFTNSPVPGETPVFHTTEDERSA
ncbi:MAG: sulfatase-like hydrolase/transferase [Planctomycetes bacterium]|nr:sulfatase-like hydrolase/transferase [Planctomycetota bacterium]